MSTYNQSKYLKASLDSIINQTYKNWKLLIIDDCSTDKTSDILKNYVNYDNRISFTKNFFQKGLTENLNNLIKQSKTQLIARMDSDDISLSTRLEKQVEFLNLNSNISVVGSNAFCIDKNDLHVFNSNFPLNDYDIKKELIYKNVFYHSSIMMRKSFLEEMNFYNTDFKKCQDYELWLRGIHTHQYANIAENLIKYRVSKYNYLNDIYKIKILKKCKNLNIFQKFASIFRTIIYIAYKRLFNEY